jgi:pimeloyl-ACP methyl ester carboxylesterase
MRPIIASLVAAGLAVGNVACFPPEQGATWIIQPWRRPVTMRPTLPFEDLSFQSGTLVLRGWVFRGARPRRGWIVYLHGISDNRESGEWLAERFVPRGYDVLLYDSRGHGLSAGDFVTYGCREKEDLIAALDAVHADRAILIGGSLGGAIALQAAPLDARILGVVAYSTFSDLRSVVLDRKPWFATRAEADEAIAIAERRAHFSADEASPLMAAPRIRVPVLLMHGAVDKETPPRHSQRILAALGGRKRLLLVPGASHNDVLNHEEAIRAIDAWIASIG